MANESPQSILALTYARIDHLAWALGSLSYKGAEYEGKLREIRGWERWIRGMALPFRAASGAPSAKPNGVPVAGTDIREFEYVEVAAVRSKAAADGVPWPNDGVRSGAGGPVKSKAPKAFCDALEVLLCEIESLSRNKGIDFQRGSMPGRKIDFQELANKFDAELRHTERTFSDYIKGICSFQKGARESDFYRKLFPDELSK